MQISPSRALLLCLLMLAASPSHAQTTYQWNSPSGGNWSLGTNWVGNFVPPSDVTTLLQFDSFGTTSGYTSTVNIANFTSNGLIFNNNSSSLLRINTSSGGSLVLAANGSTTPMLVHNGRSAVEILANIRLDASTTVAGSGTSTFTLSGVVSGVGGLVIDSAGANVVIKGDNSAWGGGVTLKTGTLIIGHSAALGTAQVLVQGGFMESTISFPAVANNFRLDGGDFIYRGSGAGLFSGVVSSVGNHGVVVHKSQITFSNASTYSGATIVQGSAISALTSDTLGDILSSTGSLTLTGTAGSALASSGLTVTQGTLTVGDGSSLPANSQGRLGDTAPVTLIKGALVMNSNSVGAAETFGALAGSSESWIHFSNNSASGVSSFTASSLSRTTTDGSFGTFKFTGQFLGSTSSGGATVSFTSTPALVGGGGADGSTTMSILPYAYSEIRLVTYSATGIRPLAPNETSLNYDTATPQTNVGVATTSLSANLSAKTINSLTLSGPGNNRLNQMIGASGAVLTVNSGTILESAQLAQITGYAALNVPSVEAVFLVSGSALDLNVPLTNATALTKGGTGRLFLSKGNSYTGPTTVNAGSIVFSELENFGSTTGITLAGGTVRYGGNSSLLGSPSLTITSAGGGLGVVDGVSWTPQSPIGGSGTLFKTDGGTLILSGGNTYAGGTVIGGGTLQIATADALGFGADITFHSDSRATLKLADTIPTLYRNIINTDGGAILDTNGFDTTITGLVSGTSGGDGFLKFGAGSLTIGSPNFNIAQVRVGGVESVLRLADQGRFGFAVPPNSLTVFNGGEVVLDDTVVNAAGRLGFRGVALDAGAFTLLGHAGQATSETVGSFGGGAGSTVTLVPGAGQSATLTAANLTATQGGLLVRGTNLGATPGANVATILLTSASLAGGGGAADTPTVNIFPAVVGDASATGMGTDFTTYHATRGVRLLSSDEYANVIASGSIVLNNVALTTHQMGIDAPTTINALKLGTGGGVSGTGILTIQNGLILSTGADNAGIATRYLFGNLTVHTASDLTIGSIVRGSILQAGNKTLTKSGDGRLTLEGPLLTPDATFTVAAGTLLLGTNGYIDPSASVAIYPGATLDLGSANVVLNTPKGGATGLPSILVLNETEMAGTIRANGRLTITGGSNQAFAGVIAGTGELHRGILSSTLKLSGASTYTGPTTLDSGSTILLGPQGSIAHSSAIHIRGGALVLDDSALGYNPVRVSPTASVNLNGTLELIGDQTVPTRRTFGPLNLTGGGGVALTAGTDAPATATFASLNRIDNGVVTFRGVQLGATAGGPRATNVYFTTPPSLFGNGPAGTPTVGILPYVMADDTVFSGTLATYDPVTGVRELTNSETTTVTPNTSTTNNVNVSSFFTHSGTTTVQSAIVSSTFTGSGTFRITSGALVLSSNMNPSSGQSLVLDFGTANGVIQGSGTIGATITGSAGVSTSAGLTLTGTNPFTGGLFIQGGSVGFTADSNLGTSGGSVTLNGSATLAYSGNTNLTLNRPMTTGTGFATIDVANSGVTLNLGAPISGVGGLSFGNSGSGSIILSGTNTYTGATRLAGRTLTITSDASLGNGGPLIFVRDLPQVVLQLAGDWTSSRPIIIADTGTIHTSGFNAALSGPISGSMGAVLTKSGAGDLRLSGINSFGGDNTGDDILILAGSMTAASDLALGINTQVAVSSGAELRIDGSFGFMGTALTLNGSGASGGGALRVLSGNSYTTGGVALFGSTTIGIDAGRLTVAGNITGGSLNKAGPGTLALATGNNYGDTIVSAGTLLVANTSGFATGGGSITVNAAAVLAGGFGSASQGGTHTFTVLASAVNSGQVTIQDGATLAPGLDASSFGVMRFVGNVAMNSNSPLGSTLALKISPTSNDAIFVIGTLAFNATAGNKVTLHVEHIGGEFLPGTYTYAIARVSSSNITGLQNLVVQDFDADPGNTFSLTRSGTDVILTYTVVVPEPRMVLTLNVLGLVALRLGASHRRRVLLRVVSTI